MNITIRAHHLLCTTEFSGHGYSEGFTAHLESVVRALHNSENHNVTLVDYPDLICEACPKLVREDAGHKAGASDDTCPNNSCPEDAENKIGASDGTGWNSSCPEHARGRCGADSNRVVLRDRDVLEAFHLQKEHPYKFSELLDALLSSLDSNSFNGLCGNCGWYEAGFCSWELLAANASVLKESLSTRS